MPIEGVHNFNKFAANVHSQFGEDGIIRELLARIDLQRSSGPAGAWSSARGMVGICPTLIDEHGYSAVLIEADSDKYKELCANLPQESVVKIREFVTFDGDTTLDALLSRTVIPLNFDFLSIDIDGNDYYILESLKKYRPLVICIEFNPTIPNEILYVQPRDFTIKRGASPRSLAELAERMGYIVVAVTRCNLVLLEGAYAQVVGLLGKPSLGDLRNDEDVRSFVFCGYDGTVMMSRPMKMMWHGLTVSEKRVQALPRLLRCFPADYNLPQRTAYQLLRAFRRPHDVVRVLRGKFFA